MKYYKCKKEGEQNKEREQGERQVRRVRIKMTKIMRIVIVHDGYPLFQPGTIRIRLW